VQIRRSAFGIEVLTPAKINLFFEVLSRRDDGFHEIETLMVPIGLYDTLILEDDPTGQVSLTARWATGFGQQLSDDKGRTNAFAYEFGNLPEVESNHAVRAIRLLTRRAGIIRGAKLILVKRIPAAAGLGGGSSDAAAALLAASVAWKLNWPVARLSAIAAELGSDVPFFLTCKPAICRGRGEKVQHVDGLPALFFVVVRPPEGLATASVYGGCRPGTPPKRVDVLIDSLRTGNIAAVGPVAHNRLLETAREQSGWIGKTLDQLAGEDCAAIGMSGSGSACFALCRSAFQARSVAARLRSRNRVSGWVWSVSSV
jgi:4-diphosphocytidyl-2-C-methyl-D-erythritol kinase